MIRKAKPRRMVRRQALRAELEKAAAGLLFTSESDYPFRFFTLPAVSDTAKAAPTAIELLGSFGLSQELMDELKVPMDTVIEERTFAGFFPSLDDLARMNGTNRDDPATVLESKRWRKLESVLHRRLHHVTVFRVGRVEIRCYIAGRDENGDLAGLVTTAVET